MLASAISRLVEDDERRPRVPGLHGNTGADHPPVHACFLCIVHHTGNNDADWSPETGDMVRCRFDFALSSLTVNSLQCTEDIPYDVAVSIITRLAPDLLERYEQSLLKRYIDADAEIRHCPTPDCPYAAIVP